MARCLVAAGSNLGRRHGSVAAALAAVGRLEGTRVVATSRPRVTPPERAGDGGAFVNAVAVVETRLDPRALLAGLLAIEDRLGRRRDRGRGPRTVDLDLVLYDGHVVRQPGLELPHPRFRGRPFVLEPAVEVAPELRDPVTGRTVRALRDALAAGPS